MRALPASSYRRLHDSTGAGAAKHLRAERRQCTVCDGVCRNLKCSCSPLNCRILHSFSPARTGHHPLRSDKQPCTHANAPLPGGVTSQDFEPALDSHDSFAADDFGIPAGQIWNITEVHVIGESSEPPAPPDSFHVFFYTDSAALPGTLVASRLANPYSGFGEFLITLTSPVTLPEGAYWVSVQAREDYSASGEWFWDNRSVISNSGAAWQNPGGGFGVGCLTWDRKTACLLTQNGPDQLFRLVGTVGRVGPTPRVRPSPAPARRLRNKPLRHRQRCQLWQYGSGL